MIIKFMTGFGEVIFGEVTELSVDYGGKPFMEKATDEDVQEVAPADHTRINYDLMDGKEGYNNFTRSDPFIYTFESFCKVYEITSRRPVFLMNEIGKTVQKY